MFEAMGVGRVVKLVSGKQAEAKLQAKKFVEQTSRAEYSEGKFVGEFVENVDEFVEKFAENETQKSILRLLIAQPCISAKRIAEAREKNGKKKRFMYKSFSYLRLCLGVY